MQVKSDRKSSKTAHVNFFSLVSKAYCEKGNLGIEVNLLFQSHVDFDCESDEFSLTLKLLLLSKFSLITNCASLDLHIHFGI